jgi:HEAT repeat protein
LARQAVPGLIERLGDENQDVSQAAITALGQIGVAAVPMLFDVAQDKKLRPALAQALGKIGGPVLPTLINALQSPKTQHAPWLATP